MYWANAAFGQEIGFQKINSRRVRTNVESKEKEDTIWHSMNFGAENMSTRSESEWWTVFRKRSAVDWSVKASLVGLTPGTRERRCDSIQGPRCAPSTFTSRAHWLLYRSALRIAPVNAGQAGHCQNTSETTDEVEEIWQIHWQSVVSVSPVHSKTIPTWPAHWGTEDVRAAPTLPPTPTSPSDGWTPDSGS